MATTRNRGFKAPLVVVPMGLLFVVLGIYRMATASGTQSIIGGVAVGVGAACVIAGVVRYRRSGSLGEPQ